MAENLTKQAIKAELKRRMEYFEKTFGFEPDTGNQEMSGKSHHVVVAFGRYRSLIEMKWQIEHNLFIGGFSA
jgi:hypothetical protein